MARFKHSLLLLLACFCLMLHAGAQVANAALNGRVTDPTGAAVPGAQVELTSTATGLGYHTLTSGRGDFSFPAIPTGAYTLQVRRNGFQTARRSVTLQVGQRAALTIALRIGSQSQVVEVQGNTRPALQTEQATVGTVVGNRLVQSLPLNGRSWDDLMLLVPGVQGNRSTEETGGTASGRSGNVNVNGVRSLQNNFLLDGVDNNTISENVQELSTESVRPSVDAIEEFKVNTDPYSAEFGRSPGAAISVQTRSGTNQLHGSVYDFLRNSVFDSRDFFLAKNSQPKPLHIQNQYGLTLGGPIIHNRWFFFGNYEGTRIEEGVTRFGAVPTANERAGDFSAAAAAANHITGGYATIIDPTTGQPFPNNVIPTNRLDPVAVKIMSLVPLPNVTPVSGPLNNNNFIRTPKLQDDTDNYFIRLDGQLTSNQNVFARYNNIHHFRYVPGLLGGIADGTGTSAWGRLWMNSYSAALGWTWTASPTMVDEFRFGWERSVSFGAQDPFGQNTLASLGIQGIPDNPIYSGGVPGLNFSGRGNVYPPYIGSPDYLPKYQKTNQFEWVDTLNIQAGSHQLKLGVDLHAPMRNVYLDLPAMRGSMSFSGQFTGNSLADFLLGYVSSAQESVYHPVDERLWMASGFVQDDWRLTPSLVVNLGLRYDFATWPMEAANQLANFNPSTGQLMYASSGSLYSRSLVQPDKNNWAPRIGIVYSLDSRTVIRAGYGRFYQLFERVGSEDQLSLNPPYLINTATSTNSTTQPLFFLQQGFPASYRDATNINLANIRIRAVNPNSVMPSIDQWNLGLQRELPWATVLTADYVGTKGTHLSYLRNLNQADPVGSGKLPYPNFGVIEYRDNSANSIYNGLDAGLTKRAGNGTTFQISYTWSHSIDESADNLNGAGSSSFPQISYNRALWRGSSDFDIRHRFVAAVSYALPAGKGHSFASTGAAAAVLGGWRTSGIFTRHSGLPFTVFASSNNNFMGPLTSALANCNGNGNLPGNQQTPDHWFNTGAFSVPAPAGPGNCGRNTVTGPGYTDLDFALARRFQVTERASADFRWEVFNLSNTPQFGLPAHDASKGNIGQITSLAGDPRVMQFSLRVSF